MLTVTYSGIPAKHIALQLAVVSW